jgi:hypothetical protein
LDRLASEIQPTLIAVLSDINMPALDGLQLLGEIMQRFSDLPGHDCNCRRDDERGGKASELGAADGGSQFVRFGARRPVLAAKPERERPLAFSKQTFVETWARRKMRRNRPFSGNNQVGDTRDLRDNRVDHMLHWGGHLAEKAA